MSLSLVKNAIDKLKIYAYRDADFRNQGSEKFEIQFNPGEYSLSYETEYEDNRAPNSSDAEQQFRRIKPSDLTFNFTIDGTGASGKKLDVKKKLEDFFKVAYVVQSDTHRPRYLLVVWGALNYKGVLKNVSVNYTLFDPNGDPLRVKVDITLSSALSYERQIAEIQPQSPDMTHYRMVKDAQKLPLLTYTIYDNDRYYIEVARKNQLVNFRRLKTGTNLAFPPVRKK
jgi:hypothetical protein